ncbi:killer toxin resistant protein [Mucor circinelloides]
MSIYKPLPSEVLVIIFRQLTSAEALGECRLVCRAWSDPAETVMFSKPLVVYRESKALKVIRRLERNPAKGRCIRNLAITDYEDQQVMKKLLRLAFTPGIERLTGKVVLDIFSSSTRLSVIYATMVEIAEKSSIKYDRLKVIPETFMLNDVYGRALLTFKETLETVHLRLFNHDDTQNVLHRFGEFKRLEVLRVEEGDFGSVEQLDAVLKGCHHLKDLYLNIEVLDQTEAPGIPANSNGIPANSDGMWEQLQVQKVPSLKTITYASPGYPLVIEYLLYKYPNMEEFNLDTFAMVEPFLDLHSVSLNFQRIQKHLKRLKKYSLHFQVPPRDNLNSKFAAAKGDINILIIQYMMQYEEDDEMNLHLDVDTLENKTRRAKFTMEVPTIGSWFYPVTLIQKAGIPLERLELDFVNGAAVNGDRMHPVQIHRSEEGVVLFDILYDFPSIKEIKMTSHQLFETTDIFSSDEAIELRSFELCGAEVTEAALKCVSYHCPQLKELKLVSCYLDLSPDSTCHVSMKYTSFDHFVYTVEPTQNMIRDVEDEDAIDHFDTVLQEMIVNWVKPDIYLWLGIKEAGRKIYFRWTAFLERPRAVSRDIFDSRFAEEAPLVYFSCFSIRSISFHLSSIVSFTISEELIRECLDCSVLSYPLEEGEMDDSDEDYEEE